MNQTISVIQKHYSIRKYEEKPLSDEQITEIVKCAQMAPTSNFVQAYTVVGIKNKATKQKIAELAGNQPYVSENGHFFVFCADFHRHTLCAEIEGSKQPLVLESTEKFLVAAVDTALAAQNAVVAAESMGLGTVYIGGIRSNIKEVSELLKLPKHVFPIVGLVVGYPSQQSEPKPRLPIENVYHEEQYEQDDELLKEQLKNYNEVISNYYEKRTNGARSDRWTEQITKMLTVEKRIALKDFLIEKGYLLK